MAITYQQQLLDYAVTTFFTIGFAHIQHRLRQTNDADLWPMAIGALVRRVVTHSVRLLDPAGPDPPWRWWRWFSLLWRVSRATPGFVSDIRSMVLPHRCPLTEPEECAICLEPCSVYPTTRSCPHVFHAKCLLQWLQTSPRSGCPCCRAPFGT